MTATLEPLNITNVREESILYDDNGECAERRVRGLKLQPSSGAQTLTALATSTGDIVLREQGVYGPRGPPLPGRLHFANSSDEIANQLYYKASALKRGVWMPNWNVSQT